MNKKQLKCLLFLFAIAAVAPDYEAHSQEKSGLKRSVTINNGDTTVNGKKFNELSNDDRAKLREEFKEMEKNFKGGTSVRTRGNEVIIRKDGEDNKEIIITQEKKEPNVLIWNDDIGAEVRSYNFKNKKHGDLNMLRPDGDSIHFGKDIRMFSFDGDSSINFKFNVDSLLSGFKTSGLDSNMRKRVVTMHRDMAPGRAGVMVFRGDAPGVEIDRRAFAGLMERNNSSFFNYSHTDKDGISSRMNIRISDANKDQLKKITGAEAVSKSLDVSDLTLFPNFSSGQMTLSFNVASKGNAKISVLDSDMKSVFTDEATNFSGNYVKQLSLPKNGVYYFTVNQNENWFVKRVVKE